MYYALIDHVGTLSSNECKTIYKKVFTYATEDEGFDDVVTMRQICREDAPFARTITSNMKQRVRHIKNPEKVFLICNELNPNVEYVIDLWESRNIPVMLFEAHPKTIYVTDDADRRLAQVWGPALGWSFSAPVILDEFKENNIELYQKRSDYEELTAQNVRTTRVTSRPDKYVEQQLKVASNEEIANFKAYFNALVENNLLEFSLEIDYIICPRCNKPYKQHQGENYCYHCGDSDNDDVVFVPYYDDSTDWDAEIFEE